MSGSPDKYFARYAYESLLLQQSHILFNGLWSDGRRYYIVCPALNQAPVTEDGRGLADWFHGSCRPVGSPVELVEEPPEGATRVTERTAEELSQLHGEPLTIADIYREFVCALPKDSPLVTVTDDHQKIVIHVDRELFEEEDNDLRIALENLKLELDVEVRVGGVHQADKKYRPPAKPPDALALISSRALRNVGGAIRNLYEADEEFWVDTRLPLFSTESLSRSDVLPEPFCPSTSSCFIDATVFPPKNIRAYLPLYRRLIIAMPLAACLDRVLEGFVATRGELVELVRRGRVQFVMPQSIERYPLDFVEELLEVDPASLLCSRQLAAASVVAIRQRMPFLYPPFGNGERRYILDMLWAARSPGFEPVADILRQQLGQSWVGMELNLSTRGAMGVASHGLGPALGELFLKVAAKDVRLELLTSAMSVEWASALGATYCPYESDGYSDANAACLCASVYSGVANRPIVNPVKNLDVFIEGLLALDNDAPILEVDDIFTSKDIDRIGKFIQGFGGEEDVRAFLRDFNSKIGNFERNQARINRLDILGLGGAAVATALSGNPYIPIGVWMLQYVLKNADPSRDVGGGVLDWMRAINARTSTEAVLVSRLRRKTGSIVRKRL